MESINTLKAREDELEREWLWLVEALNTVARARAGPSSDATPAFVPAIVENEPPSPAALVLPAAVMAMGAAGVAPASIEIALGGVIVRVRGEADPRALTAVLKALRVRA